MSAEQLSLVEVGDTDTTKVILRNSDGSLKATDLKAIQWFMIDRGLKPRSVSAPPIYHFVNRDGKDCSFNLVDIRAQYKQYRLAVQKANRRKAAA